MRASARARTTFSVAATGIAGGCAAAAAGVSAKMCITVITIGTSARFIFDLLLPMPACPLRGTTCRQRYQISSTWLRLVSTLPLQRSLVVGSVAASDAHALQWRLVSTGPFSMNIPERQASEELLSIVSGTPLSAEPGLGALTLPSYFREVTTRFAAREALVM